MFTHPNTPANYRPDIDGLRAVAVLLVVFFHAFPEYLTGGFIGVDVFFVISGFLISGIIFRKIRAGNFSFWDFYARRVRRIFPALIFLFVPLLIAGAFLLTPAEYRELGKEVALGTFFAENIYLIKNTGGYWDLSTEMMPLMHLWTLAVEEQYYIIYPILCLLAFRFWSKGRAAFLWILWIASFAFCLFQYASHPIATFFSLHTRFWELCSGCLLAYYYPQIAEWLQNSRRRLFAQALPWAGLAVILVSALVLKGSDHYPGVLTLLPVLGAVAILCGKDSRLNNTLLSRKTFVTVGLLSYTLYLWHWPIFSIARLLNGRELPDYSIRFGLVILSVAISAVSFYFFELPIRRKKASKLLVAVLASVMCAIAAAGFLIKKTNGVPQRLPKEDVAFAAQLKNSFPRWNDFCTRKYGFQGDVRDCYLSEDRPATVAVLGDSHARHLMTGLSTVWAESKNPPVYLMLAESGTPPLLDIWRRVVEPETNKEGAVPWQTQAINRVLAEPNIRTVVLGSRWNNFIVADNSVNWKNTPQFDPRDVVRRPEAFEYFLDKTLAAFAKAGKNVVLVEDVPSYPFTPASCKRPFRDMKNCVVPRNEFDQSVKEANRVLRLVAKRYPNVRIYSAWEPLCDAESCYMVRDNQAYYHDVDHLTDAGSRLVAEGLVKAVSSFDGEKPQK
jgi:peptidoglycan/LPS O-acetylase OafA/YrhL